MRYPWAVAGNKVVCVRPIESQELIKCLIRFKSLPPSQPKVGSIYTILDVSNSPYSDEIGISIDSSGWYHNCELFQPLEERDVDMFREALVKAPSELEPV